MDLLALILWAIMSGSTVIEYGKQPIDEGLVNNLSIPAIQHTGFSSGDTKQVIIQRAYEKWWLDFVIMIECENWNWDIKAKWDGGHSYGLCQMNDRWHKIPEEYFNSWEYQIEYCYGKWKGWTKFYWPDRIINGRKCKDLVKDRFIINEDITNLGGI